MADSSSTPFGTGGCSVVSNDPKRAMAHKRLQEQRRQAAAKFRVGDKVLVGGRQKGKVVKVGAGSVKVKVGLGPAKQYSPKMLTKRVD